MGPVSGSGRIGVATVACPMNDAFGQPAGFALNCISVQACCNVSRREGSCLGSSTLTVLMFDWVPSLIGIVSFTFRLAPFARLVLPWVEVLNVGLNASSLHASAFSGAEVVADCPRLLVSVLDIGRASQLVGLIVKSDGSIDTCAVYGSICRPNRTTTVPRSNGPTTALV